MAHKMRKVVLLGAFEISAEVDPPVRDGLILGSRREQRGFVLETSRENIEQIVSAAHPLQDGSPQRLPTTVGASLKRLGCELVRIELRPLDVADKNNPNGYYVQGLLIYRDPEQKFRRLAMTASEAIQVALCVQIPMMAASDLLQLDVSQFLDEIDEFSAKYHRETKDFKSFLDNVTASDFAQYMKRRKQDPPEG